MKVNLVNFYYLNLADKVEIIKLSDFIYKIITAYSQTHIHTLLIYNFKKHDYDMHYRYT